MVLGSETQGFIAAAGPEPPAPLGGRCSGSCSGLAAPRVPGSILGACRAGGRKTLLLLLFLLFLLLLPHRSHLLVPPWVSEPHGTASGSFKYHGRGLELHAGVLRAFTGCVYVPVSLNDAIRMCWRVVCSLIVFGRFLFVPPKWGAGGRAPRGHAGDGFLHLGGLG